MQDKETTGLTKPRRYALGDIEITILPDGHRAFPLPDGFVVNATREEINAALAAASMPRDTMTIVFNPVIVRSGGKTVLFDTGRRNRCRRGQSRRHLPFPRRPCERTENRRRGPDLPQCRHHCARDGVGVLDERR